MGVYIWNKLPSEYQEVEYIQSSGTQYIDTGYGNSYGVYVDMELEYTSTPSTQVIFGTEVGSGASQRLYIGATTKHSIWSSTAEANGGSVQTNTRYVYNASFVAGTGASLYVNNTLTASTSTTGYPSANLFVFAGNLRGSVAALGYMKLYYLKIYTPDKSTLVRDFVPCYRKSDNVIGMYDLVNDTFYTNQGSGTFTKGSEVNNYYEKELKNAYIGEYEFATKYQEVEYIQSSGTQRIDTGITPNSNTKVQVKLSCTNNPGFVSVGYYAGSDIQDRRLFLSHETKWAVDIPGGSGGGNRVNGWSGAYGTVEEIEFGNFYIKNLVSGQTYTGTAGTFTGTSTIKLSRDEGLNLNDSNVFYYVKIRDGNTLVRDLVPCYRISDGVIGMYDLVNNRFYTNSGTGTFTKGSDIN